MKTETSALDLHFLIKEMEFLVGGKIDKLYQDKKNLLLQIHVPSKGRQLLNIIAPSYFYLASRKPAFPQTPGGFCTFLRKYLNNAKIIGLKQAGFERIVEIKFQGKEAQYFMIIELFSKGNIILCKKDYTIMSAVETQRWSERTVRGGAKYEFPRKENNILEMNEKEINNALKSSTKESIVKSLAIEFSLGGLYSEEICATSGADKNKKPDEASSDKIFAAINELINRKLVPNISDDEILPFRLKTLKAEKVFDTLSSAIDSVITPKMILKASSNALSKHQKKIEKADEVIRRQEKQIESMKKSHDEYQRTGEEIYENYQKINDILEQINKARDKMSFKEIKEKLKGHRIITEVNEKEHKITIEL